MGFDEFIRYYLTTGPQRQTDFVYLGNKQIVTFVGKFEQLENDLKYVKKSVSLTQTYHMQILLAETETFKSISHTRDVLNLFNAYFSDDFENFGYKKIVLIHDT